jgi:hypothetical protein
MLELAGATVEIAPARFEPFDPIVDGPVLGGAGHLVADPRRAILRVPGVGTFAIAEGTRVWFDPEPSVPEGAASMWLQGTVAALVLAQRGRFALHASVVEVDGVGVAVSGLRSAGKSTTALRLTQLGHRLVTDDVSPLVAGDEVTVHPFDRPVHVFTETAASLGLDVSTARPVLPDHPKLALPTAPRGLVPLEGIAILETAEPESSVHAERVRGARAHWLIRVNIYRADVLHELWENEMFVWAGKIAAQVPVHVVTRPTAGWTVDPVARAVEQIALTGPRRPR